MALTTVKSDQIQTSVALAGSPTTTTQSASDNSTKVATTAYVETAVANLVASAPTALNTLDELAAALNDDASFSTTITNSLAGKVALSGSAQTIADSGNFTIDAATDIILDSDSGVWRFKDAGTTIFQIARDGTSYLNLYSGISDMDMRFQGNDGGSTVIALTLDMSAAGEATFNSNIISGGKIGVGTGASTINSDSIMHLKSAQPNIYFEDTDDSKSWRLEAGSVFKVQNITTSTEAFRIDQSGNLGIGTAPSSMLHLYDGGTDTKITVQSKVAANATASLLLMSRLADNSNKNVTLQAYRGNISITGDSGYGHVGIGTAPTEFFDVLGYSNSYDIGTDNSAAVVANFVPNSSNNRNGRLRIAGTTTPSNNSVALISDSSANVGMAFVTTSSSVRAETMVITSAGNVGIGTTSPSRAPLHIHQPTSNTDSNIHLTSAVTGSNSGDGFTISVSPGGAGDTSVALIQRQNAEMKFYTHATERMRIDNSGNVGIGNSNPQSALHVELDGTSGETAHFGSHSNVNTAGQYAGISLGYRETGALTYSKVKIVSAGRGDGAARQNLHFLVDTVSDGNSAVLGDSKMMIDGTTGNVGIGNTSALKTLHVQGGSNIDTMMINNVSGNNQNRYGGIAGLNYAGNQSALINYYSDSGQTYLSLGSNGNTSFRGPTMIRFFASSGPDTTSHIESFRVTHKRAIATGGSAKTPDVAMEINGPLKITNNTDGGISQTHTNMSVANSGKLIINFASIGTMTSGDTIVFTYSAISWKSWFFKIRYASTGAYIGELWAGGYNNNSDGAGIFNPKNSAANDDGTSQTATDGATLTVTRSGQGNIMTLTLNHTHVHPLFEIEYACGGGEGFPVASRASITVNS